MTIITRIEADIQGIGGVISGIRLLIPRIGSVSLGIDMIIQRITPSIHRIVLLRPGIFTFIP